VDRTRHGRMPGREGRLRPTGSCGPCGDARTGSRVRRGYACEGGIRGPCAGDGCSAGTYACSRVSLSMICRGIHRARISGVPHRLAPLTHDEERPLRGHAAPVDTW
jgi:hypothetical protein